MDGVMSDRSAKVVEVREWADPIEVTQDGLLKVDEFGRMIVYEEPDRFRKYVPGLRHRELKLDNGDVIPWDGPIPERVRWSDQGWRRDRRRSAGRSE